MNIPTEKETERILLRIARRPAIKDRRNVPSWCLFRLFGVFTLLFLALLVVAHFAFQAFGTSPGHTHTEQLAPFVVGAGISFAVALVSWWQWELYKTDLLFRDKSGQWTGMVRDADAPTERYVRLMIYEAIHGGVDKIVFGEPAQPYDVEIREKRTLAEQVAAGVMTTEEMNEIEQLLREAEVAMEPINSLRRQFDVFSSSPIKKVPVWRRSKGKWHQETPLDPNLLHVLVESLAFHAQQGITITDENQQPKHQVFYALGVDLNYCYSLTITRIQPI